MKIGDIIQFGKYDWQVIDVQDDRALIISKKTLADKAYHTINKRITWQYSDIRKWLNKVFYNTFAPEEQERIIKTKVINNNNPDFDTPGGNNTTDKLFLLSIDEYNAYKNTISIISDWWWLRSPGYYSDSAAYAIIVGIVYVYVYYVNYDYGGVRPALWLKI